MKRLITLFFILTLLVPLHAAAQTYNVVPSHTTIQFKVRNMMIMNVTGVFEKFKGIVDIDETDISKSKIDLSIETSSINTGIDMRDKHLRSSDFFDVEKFPLMTFISTKIEPGENTCKITGNLTIKGITKQVVLIVDSPDNLKKNPRTATASATVNRQDFSVNWGGIIADEVYVSIKTELIN